MSAIDEALLRDAIDNYEKDNMGIALSQFNQLAEKEHEEAFLYLSLIYKHGDGVAKDEVTAKRFKRLYVQQIEAKAASGIVSYQLKYAYILQYGDGVAVNNEKAFRLFSQLAEAGNAEAQFRLYSFYSHGWCGQPVDHTLASKWLNDATNAEWAEALYTTALMLLRESIEDHGVVNQAETMLRKAAELGFWPAKDFMAAQQRSGLMRFVP